MEEKTDRLYTRVTPAEKKRIAGLAEHCGLSQAEYIRKRALGFEPRPALNGDFYRFYYQLCDLCNQPLSPDTEDAIQALIDEIRDELILPGKQSKKEVANWQPPDSGP